MFPRLILFALLVTLARAQGGPPMITDDPGTPGDGHWEVNAAFTTERRAGERTTEMPLLDLNYGVGGRVQLKYEASWLRLSDATGRHDGFSNSLAGVKWRFYDAGEKAWQISTYPQIGFNNPGSHSDERGLAEHGTSFLLPFEVMKDFGAFSLNADFGFVRHPDADEWFGGIVVGHELSHGIELAAELHWEADVHFHDTELIANVGARFALSEKCTLLASIGRDLHNHRESQATLMAYFGLQTRL
jgi:hypothetical protein